MLYLPNAYSVPLGRGGGGMGRLGKENAPPGIAITQYSPSPSDI